MANTIIDDYELVNCLATGNISQIWEVKQVSSSQTFAMKLLLPEALADADHKASLKHEASVGKRFDHPNIIRILDLKLSKKHGYFTMEYFRAPNLKSMLRSDLTGARVRVKKLMECVTQALAHIHEKGWVHRDVKPDNILISKGSEIRVIDFSLAAPPKGGVGRLLHSRKGAVISGTKTYLPPELIQREPLGIAADIYSLGVTLYEVLCGRPPFISGNPNELLMMHVRDRPEKPSGWNDNVTPECDALVLSMLAKKPKDRPANMQEIFAAVRNLKFFKVEADDYAKQKASQKEEDFSKSLSARLDSRVDAGRTDEEKAFVAAEAKRIATEKAAMLDAAKRRLAKKGSSSTPVPAKPGAAAAAPQSPAPMPMPMPVAPPAYGYPPGYPQPMMPGYAPMPGMPMPGMPGAGMPMPGMPGYAPMPGMPMPGMAPGMMPGAQMPGMPPGAMPGFPAAPLRPPLAPAPLPPSAKAAPAPQPAKPAEEIPLMEELPDVL
ncbi:Serine/threonine-protein kinase PknB [Caulifigura coniformis]|uniref:non-specific serine/threonine protein kinase n=1 Tax=Caulifigura coniformis TaxID=2527983 RepID=A0A517SGN1_9PLAN|nr:serine/threonine-protein kinase [Caulifigura coniformis]QDT55288.1 Serine/threonine-protein kinase PknB [Caulifigura coniformis]